MFVSLEVTKGFDMQPKYNLTPAGVAQKLADLYALSDSALAVEAAAIKNDFGQWIGDNFTLTTAQQTYLNGMDISAMGYYGGQMAICFVHRRPVTLVQDEENDQLKLIRTENSLATEADDNGGFVVKGSFTFHIVYL